MKEEVELELEAEFGKYVWSDVGSPIRDLLISQKLRIRELEAVVTEIVGEEDLSLRVRPDLGYCLSKGASRRARFALHTKEEKG